MPSKPKLGQHFLHDSDAIQRIAASLGDLSGRTVVEIGPGRGAITAALAARAAHVLAIEQTREKLIKAFKMLENKVVNNPRKKHGNIPL